MIRYSLIYTILRVTCCQPTDGIVNTTSYHLLRSSGTTDQYGATTHTHTHTQPFYGSVEFVRDNPGEPVPEETFTTTLIVVINHPYLLSLSSFCSTCPYHCNLFRCSTEIMSSNSSLPLNSLLGTLSCNFTPHIHLTILISALWSATSFSFLTGQVSLPCNILLRTQLLRSETGKETMGLAKSTKSLLLGLRTSTVGCLHYTNTLAPTVHKGQQ